MHTSIATIGVMALLLAGDPAQEVLRKELAKLQGEWETIAVEINGKALDKADFKGDLLYVKSNTYVLTSAKKSMAGTFLIDPLKKPRTISTEVTSGDNKGVKSLGIYELSGDTWKLCYVTAPNKRPTEFKTEPGSMRALVIYRKVKR